MVPSQARFPYVDPLVATLPGMGDPNAHAPERLHMHFGYWDEDSPIGSGRALWAAQDRLLARVLNLLAPADGSRLLDVGCGIGGTVATINRDYDSMRIVGLNIDRAQLEVASGRVVPRGRNQISWIEADACDLPFVSSTFDRITSIENIVAFRSRQVFLVEAARLLTSGGRLVIADMILLSPSRDASDTAWIRDGIVRSFGPLPGLGEAPDYEAMAIRAGLRLRSQLDMTSQTRPMYEEVRTALREKEGPVDPDPMKPGMDALEHLHDSGHLRYVLYAFEK